MLLRLRAHRFRNLEPLDWEPGAGGHLLLGGNGAGKTSLLEAVYALATTRSFRTAQIADCVAHGADSFRLEGEVAGAARVALELAWADGRRGRRVNGATGTLAEHLAVLPVVAWSAEQAELLTGPPALRRRFLDRGVVGVRPQGLAAVGRYRKVLAQKREALLQGDRGLGVWNEMLASAAAELVAHRAAYVERLAAALAEVLAATSLALPPVELRYRPSPRAGSEGSAAVMRALERVADEERRRRQPLVGPHRDELVIAWGERRLGRVASAGERKTVGLALLAAHARVLTDAGAAPVLLIDDADAELAPDTLAALWGVFAPARQLIATSNRPSVWAKIGFARRSRVIAGRLEELVGEAG